MSELLPIKKIFNFEKGSLQSTKCTSGAYTFVTAGTDWKTHNEFTHETEALILAVAASGSLGRCHYIKDKFIASDLCFIITPKDAKLYPVDLEFYHQIFRSIKNDLVQKTATGTSKLSINRTNFGDYKIPYFDIEHQQAFKKILLNANDKKDKLLINNHNQQNLTELLKKQIIQDAISGKLTADWRTKNPNVEPASILLEKIKVEKEKLLAEKKAKKEKPFSKITKGEVPFELPAGWEWCRLGVILENFLGGYSYKSYTFKKEGKNQVLRLGNIRPNYLRLNENPIFIDDKLADATNGFKVAPDDILITMTGTRGKRDYCYTVILSNDDFSNRRLFLNQRVGCFRFMPQVISKYLNIALKNDLLLDQIYETATGSANQANIGATALKNWVIPLPPRAEQKVIVAKIENFMEHESKLEEKIKQNKQDAEMLMQSFLVEAFK